MLNKKHMKFALATKQNMTQLFDESGKVYPATVLSYDTLTITQKKVKDIDGYDAVQFGYGSKSANQISKAVKGHTNIGDAKKGFALLKEMQGLFGEKGETVPF